MSDMAIFVFLAQLVRMAIPYVLAAMGGSISERSGTINIALEGKMLMGAFCFAVGAIESGSPWVGIVCGVLGGLAVSALYGLTVLYYRSDQIVAGVAINILVMGLTRSLLKLFYGSTASSPVAPGIDVPLLLHPLLWAAVLAVVGWTILFARTRFGLRLRAVGEHPEAAASLGVSVVRVRWMALLLAGVVTGLAGAWLALDNQGFAAEMTSGRGYIALAAVIMGGWRPAWAALACVLFAGAEALGVAFKLSATGFPQELIEAFPYALALIALAGLLGRTRAPAALGRPW